MIQMAKSVLSMAGLYTLVISFYKETRARPARQRPKPVQEPFMYLHSLDDFYLYIYPHHFPQRL